MTVSANQEWDSGISRLLMCVILKIQNLNNKYLYKKVRLIGNLIQTRFVFLKFEDRKCIETKKRVCSVKVESVSFHLVPLPASKGMGN